MTGRSLQTEASRKDIEDILQNHREIHLRLDSFVNVSNNSHVTSSEAATCVCNGRHSLDEEGNTTSSENLCSADEKHLPELVAKIGTIGKRLDVVSNELRLRIHNVNERKTLFIYDKPSAETHSQNMQKWTIKFDCNTGLRSVLTKKSEDNRVLKELEDSRVLQDNGVTFQEPEKQHKATNTDDDQKGENLTSFVENKDTTGRKDQVTASAKSILVAPAFKQFKTGKPYVTLREPQFVESQYWEFAIRDEIQIGQACKRSAGIDTILCIDISRSMNDSWDAVLDFITNFVDAVRSCQPLAVDIQEYIGVVTLGHETRILQHMTKDYSEVLRKIHLLSPEGTSPMFWAIEMVHALAMSSGRSLDLKTNLICYPRVILLTDGRPTDRNLSEGFDRSEPKLERMEQRSIIRKIKDLHKEMPLSFYTIACGPNSNKDFLKTIAVKTGGNLCTVEEWPRLAKYGSNMMLAAEVYTLWKSPVTGDAKLGSQEKIEQWLSTMWGITEQDKEDIIGLLGKEISSSEDADCTDDDDDDDNGSTTSNEESCSVMGFTFPRVGTRVRRGADWIWDLQDQNGPGTIIGYSTENPGWLCIEWDIHLFQSPVKNVYRYGAEGAFDVQVVEDARVISPGRPLAVGCQVKKGPQWNQGADGPEEDVTGMVYYVNERQDKAKVSWSDGRKGKYSFGIPGKNEIEYCGPLTPNEPGLVRDLSSDLENHVPSISGCSCYRCHAERTMIQQQNGNQLDQYEDTMLQDPRMGQQDKLISRYDMDRYRHQQDLQRYRQDSHSQQLDVYQQDVASTPTEKSYFSDSSEWSDSSDEILPSIPLVTPNENETPKQGYELPEPQTDQYIINDYKFQESPKVQERNLLNKSWHAEDPGSKDSQRKLPKELTVSRSVRQYERKEFVDKSSHSLSETGKMTKPKKGNKNAKPKVS